MLLRPITGQSSMTPREFYSPERWPPHQADSARMMAKLVDHLERVEHPPVWVFTSHQSLLFTDADDYNSYLVGVGIGPRFSARGSTSGCQHRENASTR